MKNLFLTASFAFLCLTCHAAESTNKTSLDAAGSTKTCFQCDGAGKSQCRVASCRNGEADCPNPCLKLSRGVWEKLNVPGHSPNELWQKFPKKGGYDMWTQAHVGEVIQMQKGAPVNIGKCSVCGGKTKVKCSVCKGAGKIDCSLCSGKKVVPASWTAFDNPKLKDRPSRFKLKDGREIIGRKKMVSGTTVTIRTENSDVKVEASDIVSEEK